jgi:hypothetical protein
MEERRNAYKLEVREPEGKKRSVPEPETGS